MTQDRRPDDGGTVARTAVMRWALRLFRREWRQQALVMALLTVAVAAAVGLTTAVYTVAPAASDAEFGSVSHRYTLDNTDPSSVEATVAAATEYFDQLEVIRRHEVRVPGRSDSIELRAQDPAGALSGPMLTLRSGRYPSQPSEIAPSESLAVQLGVDVGGSLEFAGGESAAVVGVVENPNNLDDDFALISPGAGTGAGSVTILAEDTVDRAQLFRGADDVTPVYSSRAASEGLIAATALLGVAELSLVLVSLIAAAGFVAVAQRRQRQLGMLAAIGATEKHLRLVTITNGALIGASAAAVGAAVGLIAWFAAAPALEQTVGIRIDRFDVPWWLVAITMALAVSTATAASWWPARLVARAPITQALSGRRPRPRRAGRSIALAGALLAGGTAAVAVAGDVFSPTADGFALTNTLLIASGTMAIIAGVLLLSPLAILTLAAVPPRSPLPVRLALRDLARYQARSAAALAAISLALGIPLATIIGVSAAESGAEEGNLSSRQLLITADDLTAPFVTDRPSSEYQALDNEVDRLAAQLAAQTVIELHKVVDPAREVNEFGRPTVRIARPDEERDGPPVFFATDELLRLLDITPTEPGTELITSETGNFAYAGAIDPATGQRQPQDVTNADTIEPGYASLPTVMMTTEGLQRRGWETRPAGWLIHTAEPLTDTQIAAARDHAIAAELSIEARDNQRGLLRLRTAATAVGIILALGILAMTVGLVRSESTRDLQTLTATGATSTIRRALTAVTATGLALLGVALGTAGAYVGLIAGYIDDTSALTPVPLLHLAAIIIGVPTIAAIAGWLVAGNEPETIARQPIG